MSLNINDKCPLFEVALKDGSVFKINEFIGEKFLVIYFYPKDFTPGCSKEACSFRDNYEVFQSLNCEVIGISSDSDDSHEKFAERHQLPYVLLADKTKKIQKAFGVPKSLFGLLPGRVTYIIDKKGIIKGVYNSQIDPIGHITKAIELVTSLSSIE